MKKAFLIIGIMLAVVMASAQIETFSLHDETGTHHMTVIDNSAYYSHTPSTSSTSSKYDPYEYRENRHDIFKKHAYSAIEYDSVEITIHYMSEYINYTVDTVVTQCDGYIKKERVKHWYNKTMKSVHHYTGKATLYNCEALENGATYTFVNRKKHNPVYVMFSEGVLNIASESYRITDLREFEPGLKLQYKSESNPHDLEFEYDNEKKLQRIIVFDNESGAKIYIENAVQTDFSTEKTVTEL